MANVSQILGYNKSTSAVNKLFAAFGNDIIDVDTGLGYGLNLTSVTNVSKEIFLDNVFLQNYADLPRTFNGTAWGTTNFSRAPIAKVVKKFKERIYLLYCDFINPQYPTGAGSFPSRCFYSNLPKNERVSWGVEWGTNLITLQNNKTVTITNSIQDFVSTGIKRGDPFYITSGLSNTMQTFVDRVDSRYQLTLLDPVPEAGSGIHFWVGGNWIDFGTNDNDYLVWAEENNDEFLFFKRFSLWRYNITAKKKVKNAPGTTSPLSVINVGKYTMYFHGSNANTRKTGIYAYDGGQSIIVSRAIQPYIDGISSANYTSAVAWAEGSKYRVFVGDITNADRNISVTNAVLTWDTEGNQWSVDPIGDVITSSGRFIESNVEKWFIGNSSSQVLETSSGNAFNTVPMSWAMEIGLRYPSGSAIINEFTRVQIISKSGRGIQVKYKLLGTPEDDDDQWLPLGDLQHNNQELFIPTNHSVARGIDIKLVDQDGNANNSIIRKISIFYIPKNLRSVT